MRQELELIAVWQTLMGAAASVLDAITAEDRAKPDDVLAYLERVQKETAAATVEVSRIIEERRAA